MARASRFASEVAILRDELPRAPIPKYGVRGDVLEPASRREVMEWVGKAARCGYSRMYIARQLRMRPQWLKRWLSRDNTARAMYEIGVEEFEDLTEAEMIRRAVVGYDNGSGKIKYSDSLMNTLVTAQQPDKYDSARPRVAVGIIGVAEIEAARDDPTLDADADAIITAHLEDGKATVVPQPDPEPPEEVPVGREGRKEGDA